jgi:hypothetical protein
MDAITRDATVETSPWLLNHFDADPNNKALGLCQYSRTTLPDAVIEKSGGDVGHGGSETRDS